MSNQTTLQRLPTTADGVRLDFPPNGGFQGTPQPEILQPGKLIDRFGSPLGNSFAPAGTPIGMRSLTPITDVSQYNVYVVTKPFVVLSGPTMPYYGQPGLGTQYLSGYNVTDLLRLGYIR